MTVIHGQGGERGTISVANLTKDSPITAYELLEIADTQCPHSLLEKLKFYVRVGFLGPELVVVNKAAERG